MSLPNVPIDVSDTLLLVKLNCGEPISVQVTNPDLAGIPVVFAESSQLVEDGEEPVYIDQDYFVTAKLETSLEEEDEDGEKEDFLTLLEEAEIL